MSGTAAFSPEIVAQHQLTPGEYQKIVDILGRDPSYTELGIFSVMWSEHCSYKSSRIHLKKLPTRGKLGVQGPGENAGIIDIGGGYVIAFKIESHNHPSFIEPFQGAATGVGGILRDIFTMGARPIAVLDLLRFGRLDDPATGGRNRRILNGVVAGIAHYGNCFGVPTVGGECIFEPCYDGNPLVNVFALGVCRKEDVFYAKAAGVGNPVIYVGARTGRDGIHGASMASAGVHRGIEAEAAQRADGRSLHGEAAARGVPGSDADRRDRGDSGYGGRGADLLDVRDGQSRRSRHRDRAGPCSAARHRHDALRDHAQREPGAHAARRRQRPRGRSLPRLQEVGPGSRRNRHRHRRRQAPRPASRRDRRRDPQSRTGRRSAPLRSSAHHSAGTANGSGRSRRCKNGAGRAAPIARRARHLLQALDLGAVRLSGPHQHADQARAVGRRDRARQGDRDLDRDVAGRQRPLLPPVAARGRDPRRRRKLPQSFRRRRAACGRHQLPQFR